MPGRFERRQFLATIPRFALAAGTAGLASLGSGAQSAGRFALARSEKESAVKDAELPIVDTHQHLWDLEKLTLPWLKNPGVQKINRSFLMRDYLEAAQGTGIVQTIYMEVNVHPDQQLLEAETVLELCRQKDNPMTAAVIGGSPQESSFAKYIARFADDRRVCGVRTVLHDPDRPPKLCLQPQFIESMKLLGEMGRTFDLCMRSGEIGDGARLAEKCPKTRFVVDHCGNMSIATRDAAARKTWQEGMRAAAALENVACKISGIVVTAASESWKPADLAENIHFCLETFGEERVFFGGDWPVCTLKSPLARWVAALQEITSDRPATFRKKLFHDNALRWYRIEPRSSE